MSCGFSKEELALYAEGDLRAPAADAARRHLSTCEDCRRFLDELHSTQSWLKSLRRETAGQSECGGVRRHVMSILSERDTSGWALRIERAVVLGSRQHVFALAALGLLGALSVTVLAQMRHGPRDAPRSAAVFDGAEALLRPAGYRDWIRVGSPVAPHGSTTGRSAGRRVAAQAQGVYIDPFGYREYAKTGQFPKGTVMVWESEDRASEGSGRHDELSPVLFVSVKDGARFDGGWGFFDFTGGQGEPALRARALPESMICRTCHQRDAETDHVFTQFYPMLQTVGHGARLAVPQARTTATEIRALSRPTRSART